MYLSTSPKTLLLLGEIQLKTKSAYSENPSTKVEYKLFYYLRGTRPECDAYLKKSTKRLQKQKEILPFNICRCIHPITYMFPRWTVTRSQVTGLDGTVCQVYFIIGSFGNGSSHLCLIGFILRKSKLLLPLTGDDLATWRDVPMEVRLLTFHKLEVRALSSLLITFQRDDLQVLEKTIPGALSLQEFYLPFKKNLHTFWRDRIYKLSEVNGLRKR